MVGLTKGQNQEQAKQRKCSPKRHRVKETCRIPGGVYPEKTRPRRQLQVRCVSADGCLCVGAGRGRSGERVRGGVREEGWEYKFKLDSVNRDIRMAKSILGIVVLESALRPSRDLSRGGNTSPPGSQTGERDQMETRTS